LFESSIAAGNSASNDIRKTCGIILLISIRKRNGRILREGGEERDHAAVNSGGRSSKQGRKEGRTSVYNNNWTSQFSF
jgi:hypothetical protein